MPDGGIRHRLRRNPDARRSPVAVRRSRIFAPEAAGGRLHTLRRDDQVIIGCGANAKVISHTSMTDFFTGRRQVDIGFQRCVYRREKLQIFLPFFDLRANAMSLSWLPVCRGRFEV